MTESAPPSPGTGSLADILATLPEEFRGFQSVYDRDIRPDLEAKEGERRSAARTARRSLLAGLAVGAAGVGAGLALLDMPAIAVVSGLAAAAIVGIGRLPLMQLQREAKGLLVEPVARAFDLSYEAKPGQVTALRDLRQIGLVPSYDRARFEDRITGQRGEVAFEFFEAHLEERRTERSNGQTRRRYVTVFRGQCLRFDFHKRFFGRTVVMRDAGFFNVFGKWFGRKGMDRAALEDPSFEKAFEVYTSDQVEARFLLTPDMMQRLLDLETAFHGKKLRCAFVGNHLLIAVEGTDLFEPGSLFKRLDDPERVGDLLRDFDTVFKILDTVSERRREEVGHRGEPPDEGRKA